MDRQQKRAQALQEKYPYLQEMKACQRGVFKKCAISMPFTFVAVLAMQDMLWSKLPYKKDKMLMAPLVSAALLSYFISATETYKCKRKWMVTAEQLEFEGQGQTTFSPVNDNAGMTDDMEPNHGHDQSYSDSRYR